MKEIGVESIDLLKMDIEGSEFEVLENMFSEEIYPRQMVIDFHHLILKGGLKKLENILNRIKDDYDLFYADEADKAMTFMLKTVR